MEAKKIDLSLPSRTPTESTASSTEKKTINESPKDVDIKNVNTIPYL